MTIVVIVLVIALVALAWVHFGQRLRRPARATAHEQRGAILFPFVAAALSPRALDAALRLAHAEGATLVPVFLARVPLHLPLDAPLPRQSRHGDPAAGGDRAPRPAFDVPVDARIERGRTNRHALRQTIAHERFDRIVIAAAADASAGFDPDDVAWLLARRRARSWSCGRARRSAHPAAPVGKRWAPRPRGDVHQRQPRAGRSARLSRPTCYVERQRRDDHVGARLQHRLEQPPALVVQDLVPALARDDLRDQHGDRRVLVLDRR